MKKIAVALAGILVAGGMCFAAPVQAACTPISIGFPTTLDTFGTGTCIPSTWANELEIKMGVNSSSATSSLDYQVNHLMTSWGSEEIASSSLPWVNVSTVSLAPSTWLYATNDLSDLASATAARANLGLGSIATHPSTDYIPSSTSMVNTLAATSSAGGITFSAATGTGITANLTSLAITQFTGNLVSTLNGLTGGITINGTGTVSVATSSGQIVITGSAAGASTSTSNTWGGTQTFTNPIATNGISNTGNVTSTTESVTTSTIQHLILPNVTSTFLATDANGNIIATSTPSGGGGFTLATSSVSYSSSANSTSTVVSITVTANQRLYVFANGTVGFGINNSNNSLTMGIQVDGVTLVSENAGGQWQSDSSSGSMPLGMTAISSQLTAGSHTVSMNLTGRSGNASFSGNFYIAIGN